MSATRGRGGVLARARARRYEAIGGVAERLVALARTPPRPRARARHASRADPAQPARRDNPGWIASARSGSVTVNVVPDPILLSTVIEPPCVSTARLVMASP